MDNLNSLSRFVTQVDCESKTKFLCIDIFHFHYYYVQFCFCMQIYRRYQLECIKADFWMAHQRAAIMRERNWFFSSFFGGGEVRFAPVGLYNPALYLLFCLTLLAIIIEMSSYPLTGFRTILTSTRKAACPVLSCNTSVIFFLCLLVTFFQVKNGSCVYVTNENWPLFDLQSPPIFPFLDTVWYTNPICRDSKCHLIDPLFLNRVPQTY